MLLTNTQISRLHKAFANSSSANIKLSKTQLHKIGQSRGFLGRLLRPLLLKTGLPLIGNALKQLPKIVLIPLGLTAAPTATDVASHKKIFGSGTRLSDLASRPTLIMSNEEMNDIMKIIKSLEDSGLLIKRVSEKLKMKQKNKKVSF